MIFLVKVNFNESEYSNLLPNDISKRIKLLILHRMINSIKTYELPIFSERHCLKFNMKMMMDVNLFRFNQKHIQP